MADTEKNTTPALIPKAQLDAFKTLISEKIKKFRRKRRKNKIGAIIVQVLLILFSFGTTVLIGWKIGTKDENIKDGLINIALVLSTLATALTALDKFFDYKPFWIMYGVSISKLELVEAKLSMLVPNADGAVDGAAFDAVFKEFESVCGLMSSFYNEVRSGE
ncbi:MAG: hypothetical protein CFE23_11775 [Flavobacterium sp. BFFFF1]|uniref:SLATT domain-containing protein n=1 Tax=Flavobacterium sp. BFFFF1 TaxID=2015557 RepID=UPI000BC43319|nr:SLATT domain-containing protein [Flavobacterium sp. BFFFF1]OYU79927.1 MAG: hypothetical protein CFE23_11775 [Flavobacterium sp. BFFFF1]